MPNGDYLGKRGANAGDDYHELWAVRRALELIVPGTPLVALTVEGVLAADEAGIADAMWDGVDAACYFGPDLERIERVELVQLKYSGSSPTARWTVARLAHADNQKKTNAVIRRLATAWKTMREQRPALDAARGISVKLVSNQPVVNEVTRALAARPSDPKRTRLRKASGLGARDFTSFVAALDLSQCGDVSRFAHEERVIVALSVLKDGDVRSEFAQLREFMRKRMRPEGKGQEITAESIFSLFGHADRRAFFPCPARLEVAAPLIPRAASDTLRDRFLAGAMKLCLRGAGGEGKTTVLQDLATKLPKGSELIVYDCYGEGTYLDADGHRHRAEDAFL
ncbi:MAG: ATP-binding protein, partial [Thermoanaerobaculia bacterium]